MLNNQLARKHFFQKHNEMETKNAFYHVRIKRNETDLLCGLEGVYVYEYTTYCIRYMVYSSFSLP